MTYTEKTNVVIVGAGKLSVAGVSKNKNAYSQHVTGIFGMSTALWMLETGKYSITILDKSDVLPAPDAASTGGSFLVQNSTGNQRRLTGCL